MECYESACEKLLSIYYEDYKDTMALLDLCEIYMTYNERQFGEVNPAGCSTDFQYQSDEFVEEYKSFLEDMQKRYDDYWVRRKAREEKIYQEKVANGVPFEGMRESDMSNTILGEPDNVFDSDLIIGGVKKDTRVYRFREIGDIIFAVTCMNSRVDSVSDYRDNPIRKSTSSSGSSKKTTYNSYESYDEGYEDVYENDDYDWDRYYSDSDYADGVDDAMDELDW